MDIQRNHDRKMLSSCKAVIHDVDGAVSYRARHLCKDGPRQEEEMQSCERGKFGWRDMIWQMRWGVMLQWPSVSGRRQEQAVAPTRHLSVAGSHGGRYYSPPQ